MMLIPISISNNIVRIGLAADSGRVSLEREVTLETLSEARGGKPCFRRRVLSGLLSVIVTAPATAIVILPTVLAESRFPSVAGFVELLPSKAGAVSLDDPVDGARTDEAVQLGATRDPVFPGEIMEAVGGVHDSGTRQQMAGVWIELAFGRKTLDICTARQWETEQLALAILAECEWLQPEGRPEALDEAANLAATDWPVSVSLVFRASGGSRIATGVLGRILYRDLEGRA